MPSDLLNQTLSNSTSIIHALTNQMQTNNDTYLLVSVLSVFSSLFIYIMIFGRPLVYALQARLVAYALVRKYIGHQKKGVIIMNHAQLGLFGSMITMNDALKIEHFIRKIRKAGIQEIDLLINTFGGDLLASIRIARLLKDDPNIRVVVPKYAWSGGSLITISAQKVSANATTIFGAVDPQIGTFLTAFSAKDWQAISKDRSAGRELKDETIGMALMSQRLMKEMQGYLDALTSGKSIDKEKFLDLFLNGDYTHGHLISPENIRACGFSVDPIESDLPDRIIEKLHNTSGVFAFAPGMSPFDRA